MPVVPFDVLNALSHSIFSATGIPEEDARILADHLTTSNLLGHDSHGVWFMSHYVPSLKKKYTRWEDHTVTKEQPAFVLIDGGGANGIVSVTKALDLAVEKARSSTFGMVGLKNVSHIGRLGDYPPRMAEQGMMGHKIVPSKNHRVTMFEEGEFKSIAEAHQSPAVICGGGLL